MESGRENRKGNGQENSKRPDFAELAQMKGRLILETRRKSSSLLEGEARSVFRGRSHDFDELREYEWGDSVRDIDWKASSRTGKVLVRTYMARRKNNVLFVTDCGRKMDADTSAGEDKGDLAVLTLGTLMYLAEQQGDDYSLMFQKKDGYGLEGLSSGNYHYRYLLSLYENQVKQSCTRSLKEMLMQAAEQFRRQMMVFIVTDAEGLEQLNENLLKILTLNFDVLVLNLDDAYLFSGVFDTDRNCYEEGLLAKDSSLLRDEKEERRKRLLEREKMLRKYRMGFQTIRDEKHLISNIAELLERNHYADIR